MTDIHFIAQNQLANPIRSWGVRTVDGNVLLGVLEAHPAMLVFTGECGERELYDSFGDARTGVYELFNSTIMN